MRKTFSLVLGLFLSLCPLAATKAFAQATVVQSCGTLPKQYPLGGPRPIVVDINGNLCTNAGSPTVTIPTPLAVTITGTPISVTVTPSISIATPTVQIATPLAINVPQTAAIVSGAASDGWNTTEGSKADTAYAGSGSASLIAGIKGIYNALIATLTVTGTINVANTNANGQATMANSSPVALASNQSVGDPCTFQAKITTTVSITTATGTLVPGVSGKKIYVCGGLITDSAANELSLIESLSAVAVNPSPVMGSTTAVNGVPLVAGGGFLTGVGMGTIAQTAIASSSLFLQQAAVATAAGVLSYVQQ